MSKCKECGQEVKVAWGQTDKPYVPVPKKDLPPDFQDKADRLLSGELDEGFRTMVKNCIKYKKISVKQENWFNAQYKMAFGDQKPRAASVGTMLDKEIEDIF